MIFRDSRVWRYFFKNLRGPFAAACYAVAVANGIFYAEQFTPGGGFVVAVLFVCVPVLVYLIREMWKDAVDRVDREDEEVMRRLRE